jgi:multidrug efflux pump subunit AcrA (membrane-fusion protein)
MFLPGRFIARSVTAAAVIAFASLTGFAAVCRAQQAGALAPIQISPQRRQLIGVTVAQVKEAQVSDLLQATGMIEPDDRREAYVQTRFTGWIDRVYANQTWQYVTRGEPLFSIYSPDLVATEEEYLLALKARSQVADSTVEGVAAGAGSLVESALERLRLWGVPEGEIRRLQRERRARRAVTVLSQYVCAAGNKAVRNRRSLNRVGLRRGFSAGRGQGAAE